MTASQFAQLLHAKRIGRGKWVSKCPSHPDHKPSLSIAEGKRGVLVRCMSAGCDTKEILAAVGLTYSDLFYDAASPAVRAKVGIHTRREVLERELGLVIWLGAIEAGKRNYWEAAETRIRKEIGIIRCSIEPEQVYRELRNEKWRTMNASQRERELNQAWNALK